MKMSSLVAIAAFASLAACGSVGAEVVFCAPSDTTSAPTAAVPAAAASPAAGAAQTAPAGPKLGPVENITQPAKPAPINSDPIVQGANDLIACEASGGKIEADAFEKAKARVQADPQAVEKCRAAKK
jgi:predicted small lipoprotein YifL